MCRADPGKRRDTGCHEITGGKNRFLCGYEEGKVEILRSRHAGDAELRWE